MESTFTSVVFHKNESCFTTPGMFMYTDYCIVTSEYFLEVNIKYFKLAW